MDAADVMNSCDAKAQREGLERLTEIERAIVLVSRANFEIEMGGLDTFYYNSAGDYDATETVEAFRFVGANDAAECLMQANGLFPGGMPAKDREERFYQLEVVRSVAGETLQDLTRQYYDGDDAFSRLCRFIEANASKLEEHWSNQPN